MCYTCNKMKKYSAFKIKLKKEFQCELMTKKKGGNFFDKPMKRRKAKVGCLLSTIFTNIIVIEVVHG